MIAIIDYGVGNLFSLKSSLAMIGKEAVVTSDRGVIASADHVILPGVGAFGDAADKLRNTGMWEAVTDYAQSGRPVLGICVGMQLMFDISFEYGTHKGLSLIPGEVRSIREAGCEGLKIPHMGWNSLEYRKKSALYEGIAEGEFVYFVHSFSAFGCGEYTNAVCEYGVTLTASVERDNIYAVQFHPEKSGRTGLAILNNFCKIR